MRKTHLTPFLFFFLLLTFSNPVIAQENANNSTEEDIKQVSRSLSEKVEIVSYDFNVGEKDTITFRADTIATISITDFNSVEDSGVKEFNYRTETLNSGKTQIELELTAKRGDLTAIVTQGGNGLSLSNDRSSELIGEPTATQFVLGVIGGGMSVFFLLFVMMKHKRYKYNNKPFEVF